MLMKRVLMICLTCILFILLGFTAYKINKRTDTVLANDQKKIKTIELSNNLCIKKTVSSKSDKKEIIEIINKAQIVESNVEPRLGIGYGVHICYEDGSEKNINFLSDTMSVSTNNDTAKWYKIDSDFLPQLEKIYSHK